MRLPAASLLMLFAAVPAAAAEDMPLFLEGEALYSTMEAACPGNPDPADDEGSLQLSRSGIFGMELGCTFTAFHAERDPESDVLYSWIAVAQCGDDSGITRPDMFSIAASEDARQLTVQSQNEYNTAAAIAAIKGGEAGDPFETTRHLSATYTLCPKY